MPIKLKGGPFDGDLIDDREAGDIHGSMLCLVHHFGQGKITRHRYHPEGADADGRANYRHDPSKDERCDSTGNGVLGWFHLTKVIRPEGD